MSATYNFCAGPAMLPQAVMEKAQSELLDWNGLGTSVMEISHRSKEFIALTEQAEIDLRELMSIPSNYHVLFMHGGGRGQFSAVVNNFLGNNGKALYLVDGSWSSAAVDEAKKLAGETQIDTLNIVEKDGATSRVSIPNLKELDQDYRYLHYCPNETVDGIEIFEELDSPWPIVADMSSNIMSREIDVSRYGLIYAGAQKNIGPSGLSIVIVKDELLQLPQLPQSSIMDYRLGVKHGSMYNTPPTFAWYLAAEVFKWLKSSGGVGEVQKANERKAGTLYQFIDSCDFYENRVAVENRSVMNVTFYLKDEALNDEFIKQAKAVGLVALKGHRSVGGMRASIYNAMPLEGVEKLVEFMTDFANKNRA
ncbi:3-phosphoserine/phosphohydroxythreonine transaminase [Shewanella woodyi]|uniref:Phosphoserine aminotransferase n=1 Tax=Shewanella woodyi (strain ATCC 51908 / MS32) TaxID=392500 RepID=SERC_SHEWM|nr:3-phosphoserine/phosphohydroxythreonine transaminase [Shewanella woodyi]B1KF45.1 RecName: Full=Phosphoserine aminotransferase; AltName: Full=Phosphohydroxythreonine aminotransferase; Short=PSAT [Shewanella woodyi ATCC 51908]ACA86586.1 phosphoserine aminotransferase [Shewanella woodyi ATCC 51908]